MISPRVQAIPGENRVQKILIGITIPQILAFLFVLGRIISRVKIVRKWSADDTLIVIAWMNAFTLTVLFGVATQYGQGHHIDDVPLELLKTSFKITYTSLMSYQLALCFTKISILVFYLRVFPGRRELWLSWITIGIVVSYSIPFLILDALQCDPTTKASFFGHGVACVRPRPIMIVSATVHTMTDIWMVVMIFPVVWRLQIALRQKYSLVAILSLGLFVAVASIARILSIMKANDSDPDITWIIADFDIWTVVECSVGLICACAPMIRPLLLKMFPKFMASHQETMKNPYGRRTTPIRRMSGAIELTSTEILTHEARSPGLQDGHWQESDKLEKADLRYTGLPNSSLRIS
ncbi:hypothetical protein BKA64DRAFT_662079 [Cadophora sp. MPI-SDFR-AT-0126]|nr:hypothetical protein BKA64DRAFT_662079 [Leotiomycetes sp. MPI-SDFR-AT-0126]